MDWKWCECNRKHSDPIHKGKHGEIVCSNCDGFVVCDSCKDQRPDVSRFPLAAFEVRNRFVCHQHVWTGVALPEDSSTS